VSRDRSQIDLEEERTALACAPLSVVTWRRQIDDPVALWGHLLAYLPKIVDVIRREGPQIITLPSIQLGSDNRQRLQDFLRESTSRESTTIPELKAQRLPAMAAELRRRKLTKLEELISE
jgi:hypothetical protein